MSTICLLLHTKSTTSKQIIRNQLNLFASFRREKSFAERTTANIRVNRTVGVNIRIRRVSEARA